MTGLTGNNAITWWQAIRSDQPGYEIDQSLRFNPGDTPYSESDSSGCGESQLLGHGVVG